MKYPIRLWAILSIFIISFLVCADVIYAQSAGKRDSHWGAALFTNQETYTGDYNNTLGYFTLYGGRYTTNDLSLLSNSVDSLPSLFLEGNVGIFATGPLTIGHNNGTSGWDVNFYGTYAGTGNRMFWDASKSAFRVGRVTGTEWNDANVGAYSFAAGYNTKASGNKSIAMGDSTTASGDYSIALGHWVTASSTVDTIVLGEGISNAARLDNDVNHSLMVGFDSDIPALFVGVGDYAGTSGATGRVGINKATPSYSFDISGDFGMTTLPGVETFKVDTTGNVTASGTLTVGLSGTHGYVYGGDTTGDNFTAWANSADTYPRTMWSGNSGMHSYLKGGADFKICDEGTCFFTINESGTTYEGDSTTGVSWTGDDATTSGTSTLFMASALTAGGSVLVASGTAGADRQCFVVVADNNTILEVDCDGNLWASGVYTIAGGISLGGDLDMNNNDILNVDDIDAVTASFTTGITTVDLEATGLSEFGGAYGSTGCTITTAGVISCDGLATFTGGVVASPTLVVNAAGAQIFDVDASGNAMATGSITAGGHTTNCVLSAAGVIDCDGNIGTDGILTSAAGTSTVDDISGDQASFTTYIGDGALLTGITTADWSRVAKLGDTMSGPLYIRADTSTASLHVYNTGLSGVVARFDNSGSVGATAAVHIRSNNNNGSNYGLRVDSASQGIGIYSYTDSTASLPGRFQIDNVANGGRVLTMLTNGTGDAVYAQLSGAGGGDAISGFANSTNGRAGYFVTGSGSDTVVIHNTGASGRVLAISNNNAANSDYMLDVTTTGPGIVIRGNTSGAGHLLELEKSNGARFIVENDGDVFASGSVTADYFDATGVSGAATSTFTGNVHMNGAAATTTIAHDLVVEGVIVGGSPVEIHGGMLVYGDSNFGNISSSGTITATSFTGPMSATLTLQQVTDAGASTDNVVSMSEKLVIDDSDAGYTGGEAIEAYATGTDDVAYLYHGVGAGDGLHVETYSDNANGHGVYIDHNGTLGPALFVEVAPTVLDNAIEVYQGSTGNGLRVNQVGNGKAIYLNVTHAAAHNALDIDYDGTGDVINADHDGTGGNLIEMTDNGVPAFSVGHTGTVNASDTISASATVYTGGKAIIAYATGTNTIAYLQHGGGEGFGLVVATAQTADYSGIVIDVNGAGSGPGLKIDMEAGVSGPSILVRQRGTGDIIEATGDDTEAAFRVGNTGITYSSGTVVAPGGTTVLTVNSGGLWSSSTLTFDDTATGTYDLMTSMLPPPAGAPGIYEVSNTGIYEWDAAGSIGEYLFFSTHKPDKYSGGDAEIIIRLVHTDPTAGEEIRFSLGYDCQLDTELVDATTGSIDSGDIALPAAIKDTVSHTFTLPAAVLAASDVCGFKFIRAGLVDGAEGDAGIEHIDLAVKEYKVAQ